VKSISARAALISTFLGLAGVTQGQAEDYYIYQTPNGALVISNKEPPPGSKITKRIRFLIHLIVKLHRTNQVISRSQTDQQTARRNLPRPSSARATDMSDGKIS